jgi:ADP-ribosylglycohydrolase
MTLHDKAIGCLLGQAIGDAMGSLCEFESSSGAAAHVAQYLKDNGQLTLNGKQTRLRITDDTEMCLALARSLIRNQRYDVHDVAQSYVTWYHSHPVDVGCSTTRALQKTDVELSGATNYSIALKCAKKRNPESLSNGCLMRLAPLGIAGVNWTTDELFRNGRLDCQLTNPNPVAQEAVCLYLGALKMGLETGSFEKIKNDICGYSSPIKKLIGQAINTPSIGMIPIYEQNKVESVTTDSAYQGHLGVALYSAFYELSHTKNFIDIMTNIMSRGGDTDTNCAIAGALYGAINGYEKIPSYLIEEILQPYQRIDKYPWGNTSDLAELALLLCELSPAKLN